jgi:hypothetical protein
MCASGGWLPGIVLRMPAKSEPHALLSEALRSLEESAAMLKMLDSKSPALLAAVVAKVADLRRQVADLTRTMKRIDKGRGIERPAPETGEPEAEAGG